MKYTTKYRIKNLLPLGIATVGTLLGACTKPVPENKSSLYHATPQQTTDATNQPTITIDSSMTVITSTIVISYCKSQR